MIKRDRALAGERGPEGQARALRQVQEARPSRFRSVTASCWAPLQDTLCKWASKGIDTVNIGWYKDIKCVRIRP